VLTWIDLLDDWERGRRGSVASSRGGCGRGGGCLCGARKESLKEVQGSHVGVEIVEDSRTTAENTVPAQQGFVFLRRWGGEREGGEYLQYESDVVICVARSIECMEASTFHLKDLEMVDVLRLEPSRWVLAAPGDDILIDRRQRQIPLLELC
jgi:uncharacterized membrane protein